MTIKISVNEVNLEWSGEPTAAAVRNFYKPNADLILCDGAPVPEGYCLKDDSAVVLIKRGELPSKEEMGALMRARNPDYFLPALSEAVIAIGGAGGLGSAVAISLARSFVGTLIIADFDVVEPSNLNRQHYFTDQIGMTKVEALKVNLLRINPYLNIEVHNCKITPSNVVEIFGEADIVAECFDTAAAKAMLTENILSKTSCPLVAVSGVAGHSNVEKITCKKIGSRLTLIGDGVSAAEPGRGLTAAKVGVAANLQACKIIEILVDKYCENNS